MSRRLIWALAALALLLLALFAWKRSGGAGTPATSAPPAAAASASARALALLPHDVVDMRPRALLRGVELTGSLEPVRSAMVKAKVAGELKQLSVREGEPVRAGQVLGQIDSTEADWRLTQAQQQAQAAKAQLDIAARQLANSQALVAQGFISPTAMETASATEAGARATLQAAQAAVALAQKAKADATLVAPIGGMVAQRLVQAGERVSVDARIVEIVDLSALELQASIPAEDLGLLRVGAEARLQIDGQAAPLAATVARISPRAAAGTRAVPVWLAVPAAPGLRQGLFARGWVALSSREVLALPVDAVRQDGARPQVMVWRDGVARSAVLTLGEFGRSPQGEALVEITGGLVDGDRVLAASTGRVSEGTPLRLMAAAGAGAASVASR